MSKWLSNNTDSNPFANLAIPSFQLDAQIEGQIEIFPSTQDEREIIDQYNLRFSNYEFTIANTIKPDHAISIEIKPSHLKRSANTALSHGVCIKTTEGIALAGYKKESHSPLYLADAGLPPSADIERVSDRSYLPNTPFFLKRKFMNTSNAKSFLTGSLIEQADYFDELEVLPAFQKPSHAA